MTKSYLSLGLMSGTSGDGVDASLIRSTGSLNENNSYEVIVDKYFEEYNLKLLLQLQFQKLKSQ